MTAMMLMTLLPGFVAASAVVVLSVPVSRRVFTALTLTTPAVIVIYSKCDGHEEAKHDDNSHIHDATPA